MCVHAAPNPGVPGLARWADRPACAGAHRWRVSRYVEAGNLGDWKPVGGNVSQMRLDVGPGYRLYFTRQGNVVIVMLAGGIKSSQTRDIKRAQRIARELESES